MNLSYLNQRQNNDLFVFHGNKILLAGNFIPNVTFVAIPNLGSGCCNSNLKLGSDKY